VFEAVPRLPSGYATIQVINARRSET